MMFNPSREQVRRFFCTTWQKASERLPLAGAEVNAADIIARHPEYHSLLAHPEAAIESEWTPEAGQMNPFLHLSLHLAIFEQLSIDQPPGIRQVYAALRTRLDEHDAEHAILECLGETIWRSQREGRPPDGTAYLTALRQRAGLATV